MLIEWNEFWMKIYGHFGIIKHYSTDINDTLEYSILQNPSMINNSEQKIESNFV
jgi:hypothetical protein